MQSLWHGASTGWSARADAIVVAPVVVAPVVVVWRIEANHRTLGANDRDPPYRHGPDFK